MIFRQIHFGTLISRRILVGMEEILPKRKAQRGKRQINGKHSNTHHSRRGEKS